MFTRPTVASIAGLVLLASTVGVASPALARPASSASVSPSAVSPAQPSIGVRAAAWGTPPRNYVPPGGSFYTFPNGTGADKIAIRNRVLGTIQSTWGGYRDRYRLPLPANGTIRMATWSFSDMTIAKALVAAHKRGVSVQIVAASKANKSHSAWKYLRKQLGGAYYKRGVSNSTEKVSFARQCRGACRGSGGTPHSKYFLFNNVGSRHAKNIVFSTSANLTTFATRGQWNEAQIYHSPAIYNHFITIFRETRPGVRQSSPYRAYRAGTETSFFFPAPYARANTDPVMQALNRVTCTGAGASRTGRTQIRIIQYAMYDARGTWLAKKLRGLWNAGCDIRIIYSVSTRPVLAILRSGSGRGAIPMKQSVITNSRREIVKYNHSKWMTINGNYAGRPQNYLTFAGSANWSNAAFYCDEQMTSVVDYQTAKTHILNFNKTWAQRSSHAPGYGKNATEDRLAPAGNLVPWGKGPFKFMSAEG